MIDWNHSLPITRHAIALGIARSTVYTQPRPVSDRDLELMKLTGAVNLEICGNTFKYNFRVYAKNVPMFFQQRILYNMR